MSKYLMRHSLFSDKNTLESHIHLPPLSFLQSTQNIGKEVAFITGATGFIGGYLLKELLLQDKFKKYICLVRPSKEQNGAARVLDNLQKKGLDLSAFDHHKIIAVSGDILQPHLGLSAQDYDLVSQETDHVFHFAATMNWVTPFNHNTLENLNALKENIALCAKGKSKKLHYASSMGLWTLLHHEHQELAENAFHDKGDELAGGYFQSKWIAEQILAKAKSEGLAVNIYRIGDVKGSAEDGQGDANNFGNMVMQYFIRTGNTIDKSIPEFNFLPVDYLAKAISHISTSGQMGTFQFTNSELISFNDIEQSMKDIGLKYNSYPIENWIELLQTDRSLLGRALRAIFRPFKPDEEHTPTSFYKIGVDMFTKKHLTANTNQALIDTSINMPAMISDGVLTKYIEHIHATGK